MVDSPLIKQFDFLCSFGRWRNPRKIAKRISEHFEGCDSYGTNISSDIKVAGKMIFLFHRVGYSFCSQEGSFDIYIYIFFEFLYSLFFFFLFFFSPLCPFPKAFLPPKNKDCDLPGVIKGHSFFWGSNSAHVWENFVGFHFY